MNKRKLTADKSALAEELLATMSARPVSTRRLSSIGERLALEVQQLVSEGDGPEIHPARGPGNGTPATGDDSSKPEVVTPEKEEPSSDDAGSDLIGCCKELLVRLEKIKIVRLTTPRTFVDNVVVTALSHGKVMNPSPIPFAWPLDKDGRIEAKDMDTGEISGETPLVARVEPGQACEYSLDTNIVFWEEDPEEIGELLQQATLQLISSLAAQQGIAVPTSTSDLINALVRRITQTLGLTDDRMGAYTFSLAGRLNSTKPLRQHVWSPPWGTAYNHEEIDRSTVRLSKTFESNGGKWETSILVQRICVS